MPSKSPKRRPINRKANRQTFKDVETAAADDLASGPSAGGLTKEAYKELFAEFNNFQKDINETFLQLIRESNRNQEALMKQALTLANQGGNGKDRNKSNSFFSFFPLPKEALIFLILALIIVLALITFSIVILLVVATINPYSWLPADVQDFASKVLKLFPNMLNMFCNWLRGGA